MPLDVQNPAQIEEIFKNIKDNWGQIDGLVHCLAFAGRDELSGDYSATTSEGFDRALNISAYSLAPLCKAAKPLFSDGAGVVSCLLYTSPSPRDPKTSRMPSSA